MRATCVDAYGEEVRMLASTEADSSRAPRRRPQLALGIPAEFISRPRRNRAISWGAMEGANRATTTRGRIGCPPGQHLGTGLGTSTRAYQGRSGVLKERVGTSREGAQIDEQKA